MRLKIYLDRIYGPLAQFAEIGLRALLSRELFAVYGLVAHFEGD